MRHAVVVKLYIEAPDNLTKQDLQDWAWDYLNYNIRMDTIDKKFSNIKFGLLEVGIEEG